MTYTYNQDMPRPLCPDCGCPVNQPDGHDPEIPWYGVCAEGHGHTYQLAVEEDEDDEEDDESACDCSLTACGGVSAACEKYETTGCFEVCRHCLHERDCHK